MRRTGKRRGSPTDDMLCLKHVALCDLWRPRWERDPSQISVEGQAHGGWKMSLGDTEMTSKLAYDVSSQSGAEAALFPASTHTGILGRQSSSAWPWSGLADHCWRKRLHLAQPASVSVWLCKVTQPENILWSTHGPILNTVDLDWERES